MHFLLKALPHLSAPDSAEHALVLSCTSGLRNQLSPELLSYSPELSTVTLLKSIVLPAPTIKFTTSFCPRLQLNSTTSDEKIAQLLDLAKTASGKLPYLTKLDFVSHFFCDGRYDDDENEVGFYFKADDFKKLLSTVIVNPNRIEYLAMPVSFKLKSSEQNDDDTELLDLIATNFHSLKTLDISHFENDEVDNRFSVCEVRKADSHHAQALLRIAKANPRLERINRSFPPGSTLTILAPSFWNDIFASCGEHLRSISLPDNFSQHRTVPEFCALLDAIGNCCPRLEEVSFCIPPVLTLAEIRLNEFGDGSEDAELEQKYLLRYHDIKIEDLPSPQDRLRLINEALIRFSQKCRFIKKFEAKIYDQMIYSKTWEAIFSGSWKSSLESLSLKLIGSPTGDNEGLEDLMDSIENSDDGGFDDDDDDDDDLENNDDKDKPTKRELIRYEFDESEIENESRIVEIIANCFGGSSSRLKSLTVSDFTLASSNSLNTLFFSLRDNHNIELIKTYCCFEITDKAFLDEARGLLWASNPLTLATKFDLGDNSHDITPAVPLAIARICGRRLHSLILSQRLTTKEVLSAVAQNCPNLKVLRVVLPDQSKEFDASAYEKYVPKPPKRRMGAVKKKSYTSVPPVPEDFVSDATFLTIFKSCRALEVFIVHNVDGWCVTDRTIDYLSEFGPMGLEYFTYSTLHQRDKEFTSKHAFTSALKTAAAKFQKTRPFSRIRVDPV